MGKLGLLLRIRLDEAFGISTTKYEKNNKKKCLKYIRYVVTVFLILLGAGAAFEIALRLAEAGYTDMLPVIAYVLGSVISLVVTILKINEMISGNEDAEFLLSMPFSSVIQVIVMFLLLYLKNTFYSLLCAVPMGIVYGINAEVSAGFWGLWILGILLTSLPASGIAALIGMVIAILLSTSKNSNLIQSLISMGILTGVVFLILHMITGIGEILLQGAHLNSEVLCEKVIREITVNYKLAAFYQNGIVEQSGAWVFLFVLMSAIWYLFFVFVLSVAYQELILALKSPVSYRTYELKTLKQQNLKRALYKREIEQWLHSKSYMTNSMIGVILALLFSGFVLIKGVEPLCQMFDLVEIQSKLSMCMPLLLCFFAGMSCTSYCSMSLEGKRHWIMETVPMEERIVCGSKIKLNLTITIPMVVLSASMLSIAFKAEGLQLIAFFIIPLLYAFLSAWWGMRIDKKYVDYSNESENQTMHQSTSFFLGYLPGIAIPVIGIILILVK